MKVFSLFHIFDVCYPRILSFECFELGFSKQMNFQTNTRKVAIYLLLLSENQKFVDSVLSRVLSSVFSQVCFSSVSSVLTKLLRLELTGFVVF